jgi:hypothetical protein
MMHSYYQCHHTLGMCTLAATKYGSSDSTVATDAGNAYSMWVPLHVQEIHRNKKVIYICRYTHNI